MKSSSFWIWVGVSVLAIVLIVGAIILQQRKNKTEDAGSATQDARLEVRTIPVQELDIRIRESFPVQVEVTAFGDMPDLCTFFRSADITRTESKIFDITITAVRDPEVMCGMALVPFQETFMLPVEGLERGDYRVRSGDIEKTFTLDVDNFISTTTQRPK
ncbi:MAG: hypothetical protein LRY41_00040 [Candidatus Pacebacteria bacterium]|nr:hypothetical protein [Candidatus Paceibacterota bacterium]MCD8508251.1 hypothetical protein [Candidatus Paceibacterota bacterium]MCD8527726.1 hypothetical protein [Candidatus Paceibacterota bacterium]MCD8563477.1 hypothetical protein [Candidatus Paceibacterota bacterium]